MPSIRPETPTSTSGDVAIRRLLFVSERCYLDESDEAVARRAMVEALARRGFAAEVVCGPALGVDDEADPASWLAGRGWPADEAGGDGAEPAHLRLDVGGIPVAIQRGATRAHEVDDGERAEAIRLIMAALGRHRPDVVAVSAAGPIARDVLALARGRGAATVLLHDFRQRDPGLVLLADAVLAPSRFAADFHRETLGVGCAVLPPLVDPARVRAERPESGFVTLVDPTPGRGAYPFAAIARELAARRPDIPLLVVEGQAGVAALAQTGVDPDALADVRVLAAPADPRSYWGMARIALLPWLTWEEWPAPAVEALLNGVPVVASDRGALPEVLGEAGVGLPLPDRHTPATRVVPEPGEVAPWVEAIVRLWDDPGLARDHGRRALAESARSAPEDLEGRYAAFFEALEAHSGPPAAAPVARAKAVVLVPHLNGIEWECEQSLRGLEAAGVRVVRRAGSSAIDVARNEMISDALHDGHESILFIDSDLGFDPVDALRLLARPEPVVSGVYAKKGHRALASQFADEVEALLFGPEAPGLYPLQYAATGFLRVRAEVLRRMIDELDLPLCNTKWGRGVWPFFMPLIVPHEEDKLHYLGEDWAFSRRLAQLGITPMADTSIRLWHWGRFGYSWEDAGADHRRYRSYHYRLKRA